MRAEGAPTGTNLAAHAALEVEEALEVDALEVVGHLGLDLVGVPAQGAAVSSVLVPLGVVAKVVVTAWNTCKS